LPGTGWIDFDPTSGSVGKFGLVTVAVVRDPRHAIPLHGTFIGCQSDHLGMEVQVSVTSGAPEAIWASPSAPAHTLCPTGLVAIGTGARYV
jgi:transglutaminase-like putative cysteine protease